MGQVYYKQTFPDFSEIFVANLSLDILIEYILIKKECREKISTNPPKKNIFYEKQGHHIIQLRWLALISVAVLLHDFFL